MFDQKPEIIICLMSSPDQYCPCNLDEHFFRPVLEQDEDPIKRMEVILKGYLELHKKEPYRPPIREQGFKDEFSYYLGEVYQKNELTIYDVSWYINLPHSQEMRKEQIETIENTLVKFLQETLDVLDIDYNFLGFGYYYSDLFNPNPNKKKKIERITVQSEEFLELENQNNESNKDEFSEIKKQNDKLKNEVLKLKADLITLENLYTNEKAKHEEIINELKKAHIRTTQNLTELHEFYKQRALFEIEKKYQDQIDQLRTEKQAEVDRYQQKYFELLEKCSKHKDF